MCAITFPERERDERNIDRESECERGRESVAEMARKRERANETERASETERDRQTDTEREKHLRGE